MTHPPAEIISEYSSAPTAAFESEVPESTPPVTQEEEIESSQAPQGGNGNTQQTTPPKKPVTGTQAPTLPSHTEVPAQPEATAAYNSQLDYTKIPAEARGLLGISNADYALYKRVVTAYLNYETTVEYNYSTDRPYKVMELISYYCPVFFCDTKYDSQCVNTAYNEISIVYTSSGKAEHEALIKSFEDRVISLTGGLSALSQTERARTLYNRFVAGLSYDHGLAAENLKDNVGMIEISYLKPTYNEVYRAVTTGRGICTSYAKAYAFMLGQLDIDAMQVTSAHQSGDPAKAHAWTVFKVGDKWYFADPTFGITDRDGNFGTTIDDRNSKGFETARFQLFYIQGTSIEESLTISKEPL